MSTLEFYLPAGRWLFANFQRSMNDLQISLDVDREAYVARGNMWTRLQEFVGPRLSGSSPNVNSFPKLPQFLQSSLATHIFARRARFQSRLHGNLHVDGNERGCWSQGQEVVSKRRPDVSTLSNDFTLRRSRANGGGNFLLARYNDLPKDLAERKVAKALRAFQSRFLNVGFPWKKKKKERKKSEKEVEAVVALFTQQINFPPSRCSIASVL